MEFGKKMRVTKEAIANHPVGEDYLFINMVMQIVEEMPTKYLKKLFKLTIIDPKDTKSTLKLMNKNLPGYEKILLNELLAGDLYEFRVNIKINLKDG